MPRRASPPSAASSVCHEMEAQPGAKHEDSRGGRRCTLRGRLTSEDVGREVDDRQRIEQRQADELQVDRSGVPGGCSGNRAAGARRSLPQPPDGKRHQGQAPDGAHGQGERSEGARQAAPGQHSQSGVEQVGGGGAGSGHEPELKAAAESRVDDQDRHGADRDGDAVAGRQPLEEGCHHVRHEKVVRVSVMADGASRRGTARSVNDPGLDPQRGIRGARAIGIDRQDEGHALAGQEGQVNGDVAHAVGFTDDPLSDGKERLALPDVELIARLAAGGPALHPSSARNWSPASIDRRGYVPLIRPPLSWGDGSPTPARPRLRRWRSAGCRCGRRTRRHRGRSRGRAAGARRGSARRPPSAPRTPAPRSCRPNVSDRPAGR